MTFTLDHHIQPVNKVMGLVILALLPGIAMNSYFFAWGIFINIGIAVTMALLFESLLLLIQKKPIIPYLTDLSAVLTAVLLALTLPPLVPWWVTTIGIGFAIIIAKQLYGGLGYNIFNPAMVGYAVLLISFPREMTDWISSAPIKTLTFTETWNIIWQINPLTIPVDAISSATPLDWLKTQLSQNQNLNQINIFNQFQTWQYYPWGWINIGFLVGGLGLIYYRIISWHIPVALLTSLTITAGIMHLIDPMIYISPIFHLFSGATMLAAFFIATDPVSASTTPIGKLWYAAGIGVLIYIIRTWGSYPDGVAFAVLLMNICVPLIDNYTQPKIYGDPT